ncbi:MAG: AmpG family muropeptide MFS transporter [Maricaulaceae bacterium]
MTDTSQLQKRSWAATARAYMHPKMLAMASLGFASGLPYMLIYSELAFWMKQEGVDLSVIGFFSWIGLAYTAKVFWSPLVDRLNLPVLTRVMGQRRSWMLFAIAGTILGMLTIASANPATSVMQLAFGALILAFSGATLDISIDAWRIEAAPTDEQANMAATYIFGYRMAIIAAGLSYLVADQFNWNIAYLFMACVMAFNGCVVFFIKEPSRELRRKALTIADAVKENIVMPFFSFVGRLGVWTPIVFLLVATYLISDKTMGPMAKPLYEHIGYTATQVGLVSSFFGPWPVVLGGFLGGIVAIRFGLMKCLIIGSSLMVLTNAAFSWLATVETAETAYLFVTVGADNLAAGFAATTFIAYLSSLTELKFAATQYAFLSSLFNLVGKTLSGFTGIMAEKMGFETFFMFSAALGIPAVILALVIMLFGPEAARGIRKTESSTENPM